MRRLGGLLALGVMLGCGAHAPKPKSAEASPAPGPAAKGDAMSVSGAVGALDPVAVREKAGVVRKKAESCVADGRQKLPYLAGDVDVVVHVDVNGHARDAYFTHSTLGHGPTETCILAAFKSQQWPRPVGGKVGEIHQSLGFDTGYDDPPAAWTADELKRAMTADAHGEGPPPFKQLVDKLEGCKRDAGSGGLLVTMYLDEDGLVQGVGVSGSDEKSQKAADCVSTVVQTTSFPSSGKLVKATVEVP